MYGSKHNEDKFFILNLFAVENNWEVNKHVTKNITWGEKNVQPSVNFSEREIIVDLSTLELFDEVLQLVLVFLVSDRLFPSTLRKGKWWGEKMATLRYSNRFCFLYFFLVRYTRLMGAALYFLHSWVSMSQSARAASIKVALIPFAPSLDRALALSIAVLFETENLLAYQHIYTYFLLHTTPLCERETDFNTNKYEKPSYGFNSWRIYLLENVHEILFTHIDCNIYSLFFIYLYIWNTISSEQ